MELIGNICHESDLCVMIILYIRKGCVYEFN
jgi:hypothetical protein